MKEINEFQTEFENLYEALYNLIAIFNRSRVVTYIFSYGYLTINFHYDNSKYTSLETTKIDVVVYDFFENVVNSATLPLVPACTWYVEFLSGERDLISELENKICELYKNVNNMKTV